MFTERDIGWKYLRNSLVNRNENYVFAVSLIFLEMLAGTTAFSKIQEGILRYIDIGNNYRILLGDPIGKHLAILEPVGVEYKLQGEGYEDANSIFIHVSEGDKIERFQFRFGSGVSKKAKADDYRSLFGDPLVKDGVSIWRDAITELQIANLPDGSLVIYLIDISEKR